MKGKVMETNRRTADELRRVVEQLGAADRQVVAAAFDALIQAGAPGMAVVIEGLSHPEARVRRGCAELMDHQGTDACAERLIDLARRDPEASVRRAAIHSLGCQRCKAAPLVADVVAPLVERALADESPRVRRQAVLGLCRQSPDPRAAAALKTILNRETDRRVRSLAHQALKRHDPEYRKQAADRARAVGEKPPRFQR
jgi:HEAT repeat protein